MIRVNLRNMTGEPLDFFEATDEENAAAVIAAKLSSEEWVLSVGDSITLDEES